MGFKGGKGVACFMGMCLGINPEIGLYCILFVIITTIITDYVAVGSIIAYIILPLILIISPEIIFGVVKVIIFLQLSLYLLLLLLEFGSIGIMLVIY